MVKNKKIGCVIVSNLNHTNYGTSLQAYATMKSIQKLGYDINIIKYKKNRSIIDWAKIAPGLFLSGGLELIRDRLMFKINCKKYPKYFENIKIRCAATNKFRANVFEPYFKEYVGYEDLRNGSKDFDAIMVGSDQVWRPYGYYSYYWNLLFVDDNIPMFSYASSFGVSSIPSIQKKGTKKYLERINMISVREKKAKDIVESISNKKAKVVTDPTMLLTTKEWMEFADNSKIDIPNEPYMFCYFLGTRPEIRAEAKKLADYLGLKIVIMRHMDEYVPSDETIGDYAPYNINAYDFVNLLRNASYVCTDSFHGTVFSILNHKKFTTFYRVNPKAGNSTHSRIDSLLEIFDLSDRKYNNDIMRGLNEINYEKVDSILQDFRSFSQDFLKNACALAD